MSQILSIFSAVTELLVMIGLPLLIFALRARNGERRMASRFFVSVLLVWIGLIIHRLLIGLPVSMRRAAANGNFEYDGVGGNVAYLFGGWIIGLIGSTVALVIFAIATRILRWRKARLLAADESVRPRNTLSGEENPYAPPEVEDKDAPSA